MRQSLFGVDQPATVSLLGMGGSQIGSLSNPVPDEQVRRVLRRALDLGVTVFDTADVYGQGDSEREIGRLLQGRRGSAFVVTKLGKRFSPKMRALIPLKPVLKPLLKGRMSGGAAGPVRRESEMYEDFSPDHFAARLHASLRRLGTDYVDALMLHSPNAAVCRDPRVPEALQTLQAEGKLRFFGVCCEDVDSLEAAGAMPGLGVMQLPLDLFDRAIETGLAARLVERGVGLFVRQVIRMQPGLTPEAAVRAAIARPHLHCAIVGTHRLDHIEQLAAWASAPADKVSEARPLQTA